MNMSATVGWLGVFVMLIGISFIIAAVQSPIALLFAGQASELSIRGPRIFAGLVAGIVLILIGFWGLTQTMESLDVDVTFK